MPTRLDISNFKCFNQLRNGADFSANTSEFTSNLVGNVGEKVKVSYQATFNYFSNADISNQWTVKAGKITRVSGNFQTADGLVAGDVFLFFDDWANNDTATAEFTGTITGFADGGATVLFSVTGTQATTGAQSNVGFICNPQTSGNGHTAMINRFGLVPNGDEYSNNSLVSGNSQSYAVVGMNGITTAISGTKEGIYSDWVTGSFEAYIISNNSDYSVTYQVDHIFILTPSYIVGYLENLQNGTAPDLFAGDASLKYSFELDLRKSKTDISTSKIVRYDNLQGSVGWFDENFNGGISDYSASATYTDTANADAQTALQPSRETTASITVSKLSTPFSAGQVLTAYVQYLPLSESDYTNTSTDYTTNFLYDTIRIVEGAVAVAGTGIIKRAIATLAGDNILVEVDIDYTAEQANRLIDGNYLISILCEDSALSAGNSDRVMVLADVRTYQAIGLIAGLLTFDKFDLLVHNEELGVDAGSPFARAWNEDGLLLDFGFSLELAQSAFINELAFKLVAFKTADESYFELDSYVIDCSDFPVSAGVQQLSVNTTRGYNLATGDQFNFVKLATGAKVGTVQSYSGSFGQKMTWQDWIANINADTVFYDSAEPNNNLNQKSSNYSGLEGYTIKIIAEATLTGIDDLGLVGAGFERGEADLITVNDYGVTDDGVFTDVEIQLLDPITEVNLEGQMYNDTSTLFRSIFTTLDNNTGNVWAIHRLYESNSQGNNLIAELSSINPYPDDNALLPISGQTQLYIYASGGDIITECLIDNNRIDPAKEYNITARIDRVEGELLITGVSEIDGVYAASIDSSFVDTFSIDIYDTANAVLLGHADGVPAGSDMSIASNWLNFTSDAGLTAANMADYTVASSTIEANGTSLYSFDFQAFTANALGVLPYTDNIKITFTADLSVAFFEMDETLLSFNSSYTTTTPSETLTLPITSGAYEVQIDWGDGSTSRGTTGINTHVYAVAGSYDVKILGLMTSYNFADVGDKLKLITLIQWGDMGFSTMNTMFFGCANLTSIPNAPITGIDTVTSAISAFRGTSITSLPSNLFQNMTSLTALTATFQDTSLSVIPSNLLNGLINLTTVQGLFLNCPIASIPASLFDENTSINTFQSTFSGTLITSIPASLFLSNTLASNFNNTFGLCSSLLEIPLNLFVNNTAANTFERCFRFCSSLTTISAGLFDSASNVLSYSQTFLSCSNLNSIPANLFVNSIRATNFTDTFNGCSGLTGSSGEPWLLSSIPASLVYTLVPPDYDVGLPDGSNCFLNCSGLSDFATIPTYWK